MKKSPILTLIPLIIGFSAPALYGVDLTALPSLIGSLTSAVSDIAELATTAQRTKTTIAQQTQAIREIQKRIRQVPIEQQDTIKKELVGPTQDMLVHTNTTLTLLLTTIDKYIVRIVSFLDKGDSQTIQKLVADLTTMLNNTIGAATRVISILNPTQQE